MIGAGVGAYFVFTGHLDKLKSPFIKALKEYNPDSNLQSDKTLVTAWDQFQQDVNISYSEYDFYVLTYDNMYLFWIIML